MKLMFMCSVLVLLCLCPLQAGESKGEAKGHPEKSTRQYATPPQEVALATDYLDQTGFILNWITVGVFPNPGGRVLWDDPMPPDINAREVDFDKDYLTAVGGEKDVKPMLGGTMLDFDGKTISWQTIAADPKTGNVDLKICYDAQGKKTVQVIGYLVCFLKSDKAQRVIFSLGTDDGYKLWVNGEFVIANHTHRGVMVDDDPVPVALRKGINMVLLKVATDSGGWGAVARVVGKDFVPVTGISLLAYPKLEDKTNAK